MKQVILLLIILLASTSCIYTEEECPGYMIFTFQHDGTSKSYDKVIANDIHLRIYKDNVIYYAGIIPYDRIKNGQEYRIRKDITGEIDIVAWAVPKDEKFVAEIPTVSEDMERTGELLIMQSTTKASSTHESMGHLFLGTFTHDETNLMVNTDYPISMVDCIAQFTASLHNVPEYYTPGQDEAVWMVVNGTKAQMDIDFVPQGEDAKIRADFMIKDESVLNTEKLGLLASDEDQFITVDMYRGNVYQGTIETDIQSRPGDVIHLDIYRNSIIIYINDWRIMDVPVDWI